MKKIKKVLIWMVITMMGLPLFACRKSGKEYDYKLYNGIKLGNLEQVKEALEDGANINKIEGVSSSQSNPLMVAFYSDRDKIAEYLIKQGADVNYTNKHSISVLMDRAFNTDVYFCKLILKHGAKINQTDKNGDTALEYALRGRVKMSTESEINKLVTLLLDNGAKIRPITMKLALTGDGNSVGYCRYGIAKRILKGLIKENNKSGLVPVLEAAILGDSSKVDELIKNNKMKEKVKQQVLFYTAAFGKVETIKLLESKGIDLKLRDKSNNTLLIIASKYGNLEMVKYLLDKGLDMEAQSYDEDTAIIEASRNKYYEEVKMLIKKGAKIDDIVLYGAAGNNNVDMLKFIISSGYQLNEENKSLALVSAVKYNQLDTAKYLLDIGADINKDYNTFTPLQENCLEGNLEAVKFLVENGADINGSKVRGEPLSDAAERGQKEVVKYLIEKGADVNAMLIYEDGAGGQSVLNGAIIRGYLDIIKLLVENGADLKLPDKSAVKNTALIHAAGYGSRNIVEYLIQKGSDINYQNEEGQTALIYAASRGQTDNVKILLKYKADTSLKDKNGQTALDIANSKKFTDIVKILEAAK